MIQANAGGANVSLRVYDVSGRLVRSLLEGEIGRGDGGTSAGIEPIPANIYTHKTLSGSFIVKNPYLEALLEEKSKNSDQVWNSILEKGGSVQHLDFLSGEEKATFKTSFEIDQRWLEERAV